MVLDGRLVTPSLSSGCLAGITRQAVLEIAAESGLEAIETDVQQSAFAVASEAFLTGSVMEVMPLTRLDDGPVGSGRPGPVTGRLHRLYQEMVLQETSAARTT
jgi:branched-subunit amino acid aminotransferase/4-amino-4-deoxychorismate lyase